MMLTIEESNISLAWAKAFLALISPGQSESHSVRVTIADFEPEKAEHAKIRQRLDNELSKRRLNSCATVAGTIFPFSMWNQSLAHNDTALYTRYEKAWPGIRKCPANRNGAYFRRLTAYSPQGNTGKPINQLAFISETYKNGNHRKSALQASIFDPTRDHTHNRQKGFPCMQQVSFTPIGNKGLSITAFYATQYQFEKAYGNYLGLFWLGQFMAKQLELKLTEVTCMASVLKLGNCSKTALEGLAVDIRKFVAMPKI